MAMKENNNITSIYYILKYCNTSSYRNITNSSYDRCNQKIEDEFKKYFYENISNFTYKVKPEIINLFISNNSAFININKLTEKLIYRIYSEILSTFSNLLTLSNIENSNKYYFLYKDEIVKRTISKFEKDINNLIELTENGPTIKDIIEYYNSLNNIKKEMLKSYNVSEFIETINNNQINIIRNYTYNITIDLLNMLSKNGIKIWYIPEHIKYNKEKNNKNISVDKFIFG